MFITQNNNLVSRYTIINGMPRKLIISIFAFFLRNEFLPTPTNVIYYVTALIHNNKHRDDSNY